MDALLAAYVSGSEDEDDGLHENCGGNSTEATKISLGDEKRRKMMGAETEVNCIPSVSFCPKDPSAGDTVEESFAPGKIMSVEQHRQHANSGLSCSTGRYVSKRERAAAALAEAMSSPSSSVSPSPVGKNVLSAQLPCYIQKKLENIDPHAVNFNRLPKCLVFKLEGHTKGVNAVRWSPTHASLLASAGMDHLACIWNVWNAPGQQMVQKISSHTAAVKDIQWSIHGTSVISCGFDKTARLIDVEYGTEIKVFPDEQYMNVVRFHPLEDGIFLSGGSRGALKSWDIRVGKPVKEFSKSLGQIMDLDFSMDGKRFVSTSDIAKRNASDKAIVVWDYSTQIALSNQVYLEAYTCPCVRYHPFEDSFIAQSNANYIAIFSGQSPFKMNKYKRFEGHQVSAYRIQCNFSPDGAFVVTGSADGSVYFYSYGSSKLLKKLEAHHQVCTDVSFHPVLPSVMASCSWDGLISIFE